MIGLGTAWPPAVRRSQSGSSKARTWRPSASKPVCAVGRKRHTKRNSKPTPTTCACSTKACDQRIWPPSASASRHTICSRSPTALVLATKNECTRPRAIRNARRHGQPPAPRPLRAHRQHAPLRTGLQARRFHQRHRLPRPPPRRKHRPRQLPPPRLQHRSRQRRLERTRSNNSSRRTNAKDSVSSAPRRTQDRSNDSRVGRVPRDPPSVGSNDTAVGLAAQPTLRLSTFPQRTRHRLVPSAKRQLGEPQSSTTGRIAMVRKRSEVPLVIGGEEIGDGRTIRDSLDPSRPGTVVARYRQATESRHRSGRGSCKGRCRRLATPLNRRPRCNAPSGRR